MRLEDYLDAVAFLAAGGLVPASKWVEEYVAAAAARSLEGFT